MKLFNYYTRFIASVYEDVVPMFERLQKKGIKLFIYSSGSIEAQKFLYKYSLNGDLLPFISGHFDTTSGLKVEMTSYQNILDALNKEPEQVLFLTDIVRGLIALNTSFSFQTQFLVFFISLFNIYEKNVMLPPRLVCKFAL